MLGTAEPRWPLDEFADLDSPGQALPLHKFLCSLRYAQPLPGEDDRSQRSGVVTEYSRYNLHPPGIVTAEEILVS